jgi:predicted NAD/FAD-dependent oxidoreductase
LEGHALAWHMQWETEASNGKHDQAWSVYRSAIYARFHNRYQQETAYKAMMEVQYKESIQDMITEYDTLNVKAGITGVAY